MINKKVIISLAIISSMITSNFNIISASAFAGYDDDNTYSNGYNDNYSYNEQDDDGYGSYIFGLNIDEDTAVEVIPEDDDQFTDLLYVIENNQVTITGYDETVNFSYYTMPSIINGYPVTAIGANAFEDCSSLISIVIPSTVKTVGEYAFSGCENLETVTFENGTSYFDEEEEDNYSGYGYNSYDDSEGDTSNDIYTYNFTYSDNANNSYNSYGYDYSYSNQDDDTSTASSYNNYGYSYNSIDDQDDDDSYSYNTEETDEDNSYNSYGYNNDTQETSIDDEQEVEETTTEEEEEENIAVNSVAIYSSTLRENVNIDYSGINAIMEHAFNGCVNLETLSVPSSLSYMGAYAIEDTPYYTEKAEIKDDIIIGSVFYKYFPSYTYSYEYNDDTATYEPIVAPFDEEIPEGIVSISYSAFQNVEGLTNLTMPQTLKTIYDYAFADCTSLTEISFYDGIQYVGNNAFNNTTWLNECSGGFAITGDYLYKYVGKGGSITIPSNVKIIGNEAFALNTNITRVVVQDGVEKIMGGAFYRCENLQTALISGTVLSIGNQAFYGCKNLINVTLNDGLLSIGEKCFLSCSKLKYAIIPSSVSQIGDMSFGFDYNSIYVSYSMVDGFTLVGDLDSTAQSYAETKMLSFKTKDNFEIPKVSEEYKVVSDDEPQEVVQQPVDKNIVLGIVGGLLLLLLILSIVIYLKDKKAHPDKYKKKRKKKKKKAQKVTSKSSKQ